MVQNSLFCFFVYVCYGPDSDVGQLDNFRSWAGLGIRTSYCIGWFVLALGVLWAKTNLKKSRRTHKVHICSGEYVYQVEC